MWKWVDYLVNHVNFHQPRGWYWSAPQMTNTDIKLHRVHTHTLIKDSSKGVWGNERESTMNYGSYSNGWLTPLITGMLMWLGNKWLPVLVERWKEWVSKDSRPPMTLLDCFRGRMWRGKEKNESLQNFLHTLFIFSTLISHVADLRLSKYTTLY